MNYLLPAILFVFNYLIQLSFVRIQNFFGDTVQDNIVRYLGNYGYRNKYGS